ncbi:MAG: hypothetical protein WC405_07390 [Syntrophales bacterium]
MATTKSYKPNQPCKFLNPQALEELATQHSVLETSSFGRTRLSGVLAQDTPGAGLLGEANSASGGMA